jgi:hypothetical protein
MLPAQPGIGQIMLQARPIVLPCFINGLSNNFISDVTARFRGNARRDKPIVILYGEPFDYSEIAAKKPRAALYKLVSDQLRATILALGERERAIRADIIAGRLDDGPGWVTTIVDRLQG